VYVEIFTAPKDPTAPRDNEDRAVAYDQRTFAVVDGVTDKSGLRHDGRSGGWHAAHAIEGALRALTDAGTLAHAEVGAIVDALNAAILERYRRFGRLDAAAGDPGARFGAGAAIAHVDGASTRLVLVGDCGARLDGTVWRRAHPADEVMAALRAAAYQALTELAPRASDAERLAAARAYTVGGLLERPAEAAGLLPPAGHHRLAEWVRHALAGEFGGIDPGLLRSLADGGLRAAARLRASGGAWAHGVLDGFPLTPAQVDDVRVATASFSTLELFSDGYFGWPATGGRVAAWEAHHAEVERTDPYRIGRHRSTKGSSPGRFADDRTVVILRKEPPIHEAP